MDEWRQKLAQLRSHLESLDSAAAQGRQSVDLDQARIGRLSRMDALQAQAMNKAVSARRKAQLARIDAALARLDEDEFGYCIRCGDEIAKKRLELDPTVAVCTRCFGE